MIPLLAPGMVHRGDTCRYGRGGSQLSIPHRLDWTQDKQDMAVNGKHKIPMRVCEVEFDIGSGESGILRDHPDLIGKRSGWRDLSLRTKLTARTIDNDKNQYS